MRFGINLINNGPGATPDSLAERGRYVEEVGFDLLMISDHVVLTEDVAAAYPAPFYDPFVTLSYLAGTTSTVELGTTVLIAPYRHPLLTARMAASLDQLSGGRLVLGVGIGWAREEFAALGSDHSRRGAITDEYLEVIRAAWTSELVSYDGEFVRLRNVRTAPMPRREPHIPMWVGGASPRALRRVARFGEAWHPLHPTVAEVRRGQRELRRLAEEVGRPAPVDAPRLWLRILPEPVPGDDRPAGTGSLDQIRADVHELAELGVDAVVFDTYRREALDTAHGDDIAAFDLLAERVIDLATGQPR
ncbi:LLM class F420-dependent oxidoreductase [Pseudonocardia acaciae]|uniref:LLM class F420-dependent oxidoreductase n=1 Tax=Pseudonocardia acaciae TaxID=551276 RepID=UPI000490145C|nr:LLM class F420-dependent oxidoreductase [Pseudonocardia acaciae]